MSIQPIGQFFTEKNVFAHSAFQSWWNKIPNKNKRIILEPFAGKNGIVDMLKDLPYIKSQYQSYDIVPGRNDVEKRDTILDFPKDFKVSVTNPPFLAKNSATRQNLEIKIDPYQDLYELCLKKCLDNLDYLAVIIPESFITTPHFKNRLYAVISLTQKKIFKYTEQPVCLALFIKEETKNYHLYRNDEYLGTFKDIINKEKPYLKQRHSKYEVLFHTPDGQLGFIATDATSHLKKMMMVYARDIPDAEVNNLARLRLRIKVLKSGIPIEADLEFLNTFNRFLTQFRIDTHDITLTSFKGLRDDGMYRRRMSFSKLKLLLQHFLEYEWDNIKV